ncbi:MAG: hypothetical protein RIC14_01340 [Filomicrobium sp.]
MSWMQSKTTACCWVAVATLAMLLGGCGLSGSNTVLPRLDRDSLAAVYDTKQKDAAIKSMSQLAEKRQAEADKALSKQNSKP